MKSCGTCGTQVDDAATICPTCGGPIGNPVISANDTDAVTKSETSTTDTKPKKKGKTLKIILIVIAILILLSAINSCSKSCSTSSGKSEDWPTGPLAQMIPSMNKKCAYVNEGKTSLSIRIEQGISKNDYSDYVKKCKEWGYTVEADEQSNDYDAFNEEGYKLEVNFRDYSKNEISISLSAPKATGTLVWPNIGLATMIPNPGKSQGDIEIDSASQLLVYVGSVTKSEYDSYVNKCIAAGFNVNYDKGSKNFTAKNSQGDSLRIEYRGFKTMCISMHAAKDTDNGTSSSPAKTAEPAQTPAQSATTDSTFKQTMDDYEKFIDDYIAFMQKYESSSDTSSMTKDYMKMLTDYSTMMQTIDSIDEDSLSEADRKYYTEVNARVAKKLSDALLE